MKKIPWGIKVYILALIVLPSLSCAYTIKKSDDNSDTLVLVHVLFRHGDMAPSKGELWKTNPYYNESYYKPYGYGQLTNDGKKRMYDVGLALRNRYDTFLGATWDINVLDAWTPDYNRTKMSISLVLSGLYQPSESLIWNKNLLWQPIPFNYLPFSEDKELSSWACPTVLPLIYNTTSTVERLEAYDGLIDSLSNGTGEEVDYISALDLYLGMQTLTELGFSLEDWTQAIYPEPLKKYMIDFYYIETSTTELKKIIAGYFLRKIISDTQNKINGSLNPEERKIFLYCGFETNLGTLIAALGLLDMDDIPAFGSYLLFEVHKIDDVYGFKILYQNNDNEDPIQLTLPGCENFCPLDDFVKLTADIIPQSDDDCYNV